MPKFTVTVKSPGQVQKFDLEADNSGDALRKAAQRYKDDRLKEGDYSSLFVTFEIVRHPD